MLKRMKLVQDDCLDVMPTIKDGCIDMILVDPPYGTTACKWDSVIPLEPMWKQLKRIIKPNGAIVITASQPFTTTLISSNIEMFKYCWVWEKTQATGHLNVNKRPMVAHEDIVVFYVKQSLYHPQKTQDHKPMNSGVRRSTHVNNCYGDMNKVDMPFGGNTDRFPRSVIRFSSDKQKDYLHPTQKPVALMEYLIRTYTNKGDIVLDFAMGSGTTGVACQNLNRKFIGIELDPTYFKIASDRLRGDI